MHLMTADGRPAQAAAAVQALLARHRRPPTIREIAAEMGLATSTIMLYLERAVDAGLLEKRGTRAAFWPVVTGRCPLCGQVASDR